MGDVFDIVLIVIGILCYYFSSEAKTGAPLVRILGIVLFVVGLLLLVIGLAA